MLNTQTDHIAVLRHIRARMFVLEPTTTCSYDNHADHTHKQNYHFDNKTTDRTAAAKMSSARRTHTSFNNNSTIALVFLCSAH